MKRPTLKIGSNPAIETILLMALISVFACLGRAIGFFEPFVLQPPITDGWWQLPLSVYAHSSPTHFLANAVVVLVAGGIISIKATPLRFHIFFLLTGVISGTANVLVPGVSGESVAILGASGAAFGLVGYLLVSNAVSARLFGRTSSRVAVSVFLALALWLTLVSSGVNVGNLAHFSGIIIGGIAGYFNILRSKRLVPSSSS